MRSVGSSWYAPAPLTPKHHASPGPASVVGQYPPCGVELRPRPTYLWKAAARVSDGSGAARPKALGGSSSCPAAYWLGLWTDCELGRHHHVCSGEKCSKKSSSGGQYWPHRNR